MKQIKGEGTMEIFAAVILIVVALVVIWSAVKKPKDDKPIVDPMAGVLLEIGKLRLSIEESSKESARVTEHFAQQLTQLEQRVAADKLEIDNLKKAPAPPNRPMRIVIEKWPDLDLEFINSLRAVLYKGVRPLAVKPGTAVPGAAEAIKKIKELEDKKHGK